MIGKCSILVASTNMRNQMVGSAGTGCVALDASIVVAITKTLAPKWIKTINKNMANFFTTSHTQEVS